MNNLKPIYICKSDICRFILAFLKMPSPLVKPLIKISPQAQVNKLFYFYSWINEKQIDRPLNIYKRSAVGLKKLKISASRHFLKERTTFN